MANDSPDLLHQRKRGLVSIVKEAGLAPRTGLNGCVKPSQHRDSIPGMLSPYRNALPAELSRSTPVPQTRVVLTRETRG